jgi:hypothetical protein
MEIRVRRSPVGVLVLNTNAGRALAMPRALEYVHPKVILVWPAQRST